MLHETGDVLVKHMYFYRQNHFMTSSLKEYSRNHPSEPCKVIVTLKPIREAERIPTTPGLIIRVIGHKVSSVEIGREHKRNIHNPVNDSLGLRCKLY